MTDAEINEIVSDVLRRKFADFESASTASEVDFDGTSIIRVTARYRDSLVASESRIDAIHDLRTELLKRGEERFVFLVNRYPNEETIEEDVE